MTTSLNDSTCSAIVFTAVSPFTALLTVLETWTLNDSDLLKVIPRYLRLCSLCRLLTCILI